MASSSFGSSTDLSAYYDTAAQRIIDNAEGYASHRSQVKRYCRRQMLAAALQYNKVGALLAIIDGLDGHVDLLDPQNHEALVDASSHLQFRNPLALYCTLTGDENANALLDLI